MRYSQTTSSFHVVSKYNPVTLGFSARHVMDFPSSSVDGTKLNSDRVVLFSVSSCLLCIFSPCCCCCEGERKKKRKEKESVTKWMRRCLEIVKNKMEMNAMVRIKNDFQNKFGFCSLCMCAHASAANADAVACVHFMHIAHSVRLNDGVCPLILLENLHMWRTWTTFDFRGAKSQFAHIKLAKEPTIAKITMEIESGRERRRASCEWVARAHKIPGNCRFSFRLLWPPMWLRVCECTADTPHTPCRRNRASDDDAFFFKYS